MLITNVEQATHAGISLKMTCGYCRKPITTYLFYGASDCDLTRVSYDQGFASRVFFLERPGILRMP
jgi:hypothetical protein